MSKRFKVEVCGMGNNLNFGNVIDMDNPRNLLEYIMHSLEDIRVRGFDLENDYFFQTYLERRGLYFNVEVTVYIEGVKILQNGVYMMFHEICESIKRQLNESLNY